MITFEVFLLGLLIVSTFTSLVTEAVKTILKEYDKKFHANTLAGIVAAVLSAAVGVGYLLIAGISFTAQTIACIFALIFLSWLCAMVGYDKVIQVISQFKTSGKE
jgi:uncharacterized membrane protein YesL